MPGPEFPQLCVAKLQSLAAPSPTHTEFWNPERPAELQAGRQAGRQAELLHMPSHLFEVTPRAPSPRWQVILVKKGLPLSLLSKAPSCSLNSFSLARAGCLSSYLSVCPLFLLLCLSLCIPCLPCALVCVVLRSCRVLAVLVLLQRWGCLVLPCTLPAYSRSTCFHLRPRGGVQ